MPRSCLLSVEILDTVPHHKFLLRKDKMRLRFFQSDFGTFQELGTVAMVVEGIKVVRGGPLEEKILASQSVSQMTPLMELTTEMGRLLPFWLSVKLSNNAQTVTNHYKQNKLLQLGWGGHGKNSVLH